MENTSSVKNIDIKELLRKGLAHSVSYETYRALVADLAAKGASTGPEQSESLTNYTLLNNARMKRLDKTIRIPQEIEEKFKDFKGNQTWLVLTESWCGDAAHAMPVMNKLALLAPHIDLKVALRDQHIDLIDAFLSDGARSIPKLLVWDKDAKEVVAEWGPRPSIATTMVQEFKAIHGALSPEFKEELQHWYNRDKSQNIISDLSSLID